MVKTQRVKKEVVFNIFLLLVTIIILIVIIVLLYNSVKNNKTTTPCDDVDTIIVPFNPSEPTNSVKNNKTTTPCDDVDTIIVPFNPSEPTDITASEWVLVTVNGTRNQTPFQYVLDLRDNHSFQGIDSCNSIGGNYDTNGPLIEFTNMTKTKVGCSSIFNMHQILSTVRSYQINNGKTRWESRELYLFSDTGDVYVYTEVVRGKPMQHTDGNWYMLVGTMEVTVTHTILSPADLSKHEHHICRLVNMKQSTNENMPNIPGVYCTIDDYDFINIDNPIESKWVLQNKNNQFTLDNTLDLKIPNSNEQHKSIRKQQVGFLGVEACNNLSGNYHIGKHNQINFSNISKTEMLCSPPTTFDLSNMLNRITSYRIVRGKYEWESRELHLIAADDIFTYAEVVIGRPQKNDLEGGYWYILVNTAKVKISGMSDTTLKEHRTFLCHLVNLKFDDADTVGIPTDAHLCTVDTFEFVPEVVYGRPLMKSEKKLLPIVSDTRSDWTTYPLQPEVLYEIDQMEDSDRRTQGSEWLRMAQEEYSSIASFGRLVLDLSRFGFPAELFDRVTSALSDEIRHARIFLSLASHALEKPMNFKQLCWGHITEKTWDQLQTDNYRDACCNEAHSAKMLLQNADKVRRTQPTIALLVMEISRDERRHSVLGEDIHTFMQN